MPFNNIAWNHLFFEVISLIKMFLKHKKFRQTDGQTPTISAVNANGLKSEK